MKNLSLLRLVSTHFPMLISLKRFALAFKDAVSAVQNTYSQYGEDRFILNELRNANLSGFIYVDVGANQPTRISNTYLFYRHGHHGITIEPNPQMKSLHRIFRPRDKFLGVGCGKHVGIFEFRHASQSVTSGFTSVTKDYIRTEYIPVLTLDTVLNAVDRRPIFLLSIDVEGMDLEVLQGGTEALSRTIFLIVEDSKQDPALQTFVEQHGFQLVNRFHCNLVFHRLNAQL